MSLFINASFLIEKSLKFCDTYFMNEKTKDFLNELRQDTEVKSVILFGSHARGNARENSDVDLIVICNETKRGVQERNGQIFEIVYVTEPDAKNYYIANKDNAVRTWKTAEILHDSDGSAQRLKSFVFDIEKEGKKVIDEEKRDHLRFDIEDFIRALRVISVEDTVEARYLINLKLSQLLELYFDIKGLWKPAPKQLLDEIKSLDNKLHKNITLFYQNHDLDSKLDHFEAIYHKIFQKDN